MSLFVRPLLAAKFKVTAELHWPITVIPEVTDPVLEDIMANGVSKGRFLIQYLVGIPVKLQPLTTIEPSIKLTYVR